MQQEISYKNYFEHLSKDLTDPRSNIGKRHNLAFVCCCVLIAIMNGRLYPTAIQRYIKNRHADLCIELSHNSKKPISLSQLLRVLRLIDWEEWNAVNKVYFNQVVQIQSCEEQEEQWWTTDGKELRGSIKDGDKRGLNVVRAIGQEDKIVLVQKYYDGSKESEKIEVREIVSQEAKGKKVTFDALHCEPETLSIVASNEGKYIVQVKKNQKLLVEELEAATYYLPKSGTCITHDKGHGRVESRTYTCYDLRHPFFEDRLDERWIACDINTLIVCNRKFTRLKDDKVEEQTSLYMSNDKHLDKDPERLKAKEWGNAIRNHWQIESDHYVRDVTFKEDFLNIKDHQIQKIMSICISAVVMIFRKINVTNFQAATESFSDQPYPFFAKLRNIQFL